MSFLKGKTAIITGAGYAALSDGRCGSIGYGIATAYAKEGANLVITGRNVEKLNKAKQELENNYGIKVLALSADISEGADNEAIAKGFPAGLVLPSCAEDDGNNEELRISFDFDGVIADDSSEKIFQQNGLDAFRQNEIIHAESAISPGPLGELFCKLGTLRTLEDRLEEQDPAYRRFLKTFIVTARSAPTHRRVINTLRQWNIPVDEIHFLGGMDKGRIMETLKPHIFFDDQKNPHLDSVGKFAPAVHIPFGIMAKG